MRYAREETADRGLTFRSGVVDWDTLANVVVTDASHANEAEVGVDASGEIKEEPHRSQGGRIQMIANQSDLTREKLSCHVVGYSRNTIKRVCRATVQAEAYGMTNGVEEGDRIRAAIADLHDRLEPGPGSLPHQHTCRKSDSQIAAV